jgi:ribosomal protein L11 methyltransferase
LQVVSPEVLEADTADLVLANILSGTLIELAPMLGSLARPGGWLVLAGILRHQADPVRSAYADRFPALEGVYQAEWVRLAGRAQG